MSNKVYKGKDAKIAVDGKQIDFSLPLPNLPELNAVANAIIILEESLQQGQSGLYLKRDIKKALKQMKAFCKFSKEFEAKPLFWHDFKEKYPELFE